MLYRKIILSAFGLIPACVVLAQLQPKTIADKIAAVVGDRIILSSDIQNSIDDLARQNIPLPANAACLITRQAIMSKLLMLQAMKDSLPVTDEDVEAELNRRIGQFAPEYDAETIDKIKNDARDHVKERMLAEAMRQKIVDGIRISPAEVKSFFDGIPHDSLPGVEAEMEVGQIVFYPAASKELELYVINELNNYKKQVENKTISFCQLEKVTDKQDACNDYQINRNNKYWDPVFLSAAFHLKEGELSAPVKCKLGFFLIQMVERKADDAIVRYIFRPHPLTDVEINLAKSQLNKLRTEIMDGRIGFNEAALKYSEDNGVKFSGPFLLNKDGASSITIDQVEKDVAEIINTMNAGEISRPMFFMDHQNIKGVRIFFLKSRSQPHLMNLRQDYSRISQMALEQKKQNALDKWISEKTPSFYIMIDNAMSVACPEIKRFASTDHTDFKD